MRNYNDYYRELNVGARRLRDAIPTTMAGYGQLRSSGLKPGALSAKEKELIALGIAITVPCEGCITYHVRDALRAGATRAEIAEAVGVAVLMGGGPSVIHGSEALEALQQFQEHPKEWATASD